MDAYRRANRKGGRDSKQLTIWTDEGEPYGGSPFFMETKKKEGDAQNEKHINYICIIS